MKLTKKLLTLYIIIKKYSLGLVAFVQDYLSLNRLRKNGIFFKIGLFCNLNIFLWHFRTLENNLSPIESLTKQFNIHSTL